MHDGGAMGGVHRGGELLGELDPLGDAGLLSISPGRQSVAVDPFEHEPGDSVDLGEVVQAANVRMVETRQGLCLAPESTHGRRAGRAETGGAQALERDGSVQLGIAGSEDLAHATFTQSSGDLELADARADFDLRGPAGKGLRRESAASGDGLVRIEPSSESLGATDQGFVVLDILATGVALIPWTGAEATGGLFVRHGESVRR